MCSARDSEPSEQTSLYEADRSFPDLLREIKVPFRLHPSPQIPGPPP